MGDLAPYIGNRPFNKVILPRSHDTGTYNLDPTIAPKQAITDQLNVLKSFGIGYIVTDVIKTWAKTQNLNVYDQLKSGIRGLDLRIILKDSDKDFYTVHGLYGPSMSDLLNQTTKFLDENPKEIIIVSVGDLSYLGATPEENKQEIIRRLKVAFGERLARKGELSPSSTMNQIWATKRRVFLFFVDDKYTVNDPQLWSNSMTTGGWTNTQRIDALERGLHQKIDERIALVAAGKGVSDTFFSYSATLTPDGDTIGAAYNPINLAFLNKSVCTNLEGLAGSVKIFLPNWLATWKDKVALNFIDYDFVDPDMNKYIINLNTLLGQSLTPPPIPAVDVCARYSCPTGFTDTGAHCLKPAAYGRGAGYVIWPTRPCSNPPIPDVNPGGCEQCLALDYPRCNFGFQPVGCNICSPICPAYSTDIGISCQKSFR